MKKLLRARKKNVVEHVVVRLRAYAAAVTLVSAQGSNGSPSADLMVLMGH